MGLPDAAHVLEERVGDKEAFVGLNDTGPKSLQGCGARPRKVAADLQQVGQNCGTGCRFSYR